MGAGQMVPGTCLEGSISKHLPRNAGSKCGTNVGGCHNCRAPGRRSQTMLRGFIQFVKFRLAE
eukprot:2557669-Pyramimonas_sp.AAC.1